MNRYENGKIYQIIDCGYNKCYIGSTCESLSKRMERHRKAYRAYTNEKTKKITTCISIFDEYGVENCKIELIENYPCENVEELRRREGIYIQNTDCVNRLVAGRTMEEYREQNKDLIKERNRESYYKNFENYRERKNALARENYERRKDEIKQRRKQKYEENKEERRAKALEWYYKNRDRILEKKGKSD